jgi:hypothetical protein
LEKLEGSKTKNKAKEAKNDQKAKNREKKRNYKPLPEIFQEGIA